MQALVRTSATRKALLHLGQTTRSVLMMTAHICKTLPHQPSPQPQTAGYQQAEGRAPARTWHHCVLCLQEAHFLAVQHHLARVMSAKAQLLVTQGPLASRTQASGKHYLN